MAKSAAREVIPDEILRILSLHGPVQLVGGAPGREVSARCHVAPFEDLLFFFVTRRAPVAQALLAHTNAEVHCKDDDKGYQIHLKGRALAGPMVMAHPRRLELLPWLPDGASPAGFAVVEFYCEHVDYLKRKEDGSELRYKGKTPLGMHAPAMGTRWSRIAFGGITPVVVLSLAAIWFYLAYMGADYPMRWFALGIAWLGCLLMQAGARFWFRGTAFLRWREGRAHRDECGSLLGEALLAPKPLRDLASMASIAGVLCTLGLYAWPDGLLPWVVFGSSCVWIMWPLWVLHLSQSEPEVRDL